MMRRALLTACCALAALAGSARADLGGYTIASFRTDVVVLPNSDLTVEEHIDVDFQQPRHGIYRTIPVHYTDPIGYGYSLGLRVLGITDGRGHAWKYNVQGSGRYVKIRIGDPDRTVSGPVSYVLRYRVRNALGHFARNDELYWNATGNEWNVRIDRASATVHLPAPLPADSLETDAFAGRFGSREKGAVISYPEPGTVTFEATRPLGSLEGLTIAVAWPKGYVAVPGAWRRALRFLGDNWILFAPIAFLLWLWSRYRSRGRDPRGPVSVMVRYEPPPGMTPGEIGTIVDEKVDLRDITATLVDLAVRGYVVIRMERRDILLGLSHREETIFERTKKEWNDLQPHEVSLLSGLFETGDVVEASDLKEHFYRHIPGIRKSLYTRLVKTGYFSSSPDTVRQRYAGLGIAAGIAVFVVGMLWVKVRGGVLPNGLVLPILSGFVTAVLFFLFAPAMPRRTAAGVRMRAWARGFEEFVDRVESEKLERDRARNVYETLLPYAMALGVASRWARRFEGIYDQPPAWFQGGSPGAVFSAIAFNSALSSAMERAGSTMTASPRSSGASGTGGGGFSGGGGGGGGGGSW